MTIGVSVTALTLSSSASFDFWPALIGPDCAVRPCIEAALKNALGRHCKLCMQSSRSETTAKVYGRSMTIKCYCRVVELSGGKEIERPIQHMLLVFNNPPRWAKQSPVNCVKSCWKTNQMQVKIRCCLIMSIKHGRQGLLVLEEKGGVNLIRKAEHWIKKH